MRIQHIAERCYGCRACELACSFHQRREFSPRGGSIQVSKDNRSGKIEWLMDSTCDRCREEECVLCVKNCSYQALAAVQEEDAG